jgi:cell wall-associated NlpC family hydrolase
MSYQPQLGDYGVVATKGIVGWLIQLGTLTKYNHAFVYVGDNTIIEATPVKGVILSPVSKYENIVWNRHEVKTDAQREALVKAALKHLRHRYSFLAIAAIALQIFHLRRPKWMIARLAKSGNDICSQLVAQDYRACGFAIDGSKPDFYITPSDLVYRLLYI